jgi:Restriction endonuclease/TIR domain
MLKSGYRAEAAGNRQGIMFIAWCVVVALTVGAMRAGGSALLAPSVERGARAGPAAYCRAMPGDKPPSRRTVFISFTYEAAPVAGEIERALGADGMDVRADRADLPQGETWLRHLDHAVTGAGSFIAVLVGAPRDAIRTGHWAEAARAVQRRGIDVVPVVQPAAGIDSLAGWPVVEYAGPDASRLVADRVRLGAAIDLAGVTGPVLEALVSDLLQRIGWTIAPGAGRGDEGYDLRITREPGPDINWPPESLVEIKAYRDHRVSVSAISQLASVVQRHQDTAGLLVTNGQLTTVARNYAAGTSEAGTPIQVIDGTELRQMLIRHPDIALRHIPVPDPGAEQ